MSCASCGEDEGLVDGYCMACRVCVECDQVSDAALDDDGYCADCTEPDDDDGECAFCGGSGGGDDAALRCPYCRGRG